MTLRSRLVVAMVLLAAVGLTLFGFTTSYLYQRSQLSQLDDQLQAITAPQTVRLQRLLRDVSTPSTTCADSGGPEPPNPGRGGFGPGQGLDAFAALVTTSGVRVACIDALSTTGQPELPSDIPKSTEASYATTGSAKGHGRWRLLATPVVSQIGGTSTDLVIIVAVPTSGIDSSMSQLVRIELTSALILLLALTAGTWLILRRGLRPLEKMASSAATITAGNLTERVAPADDHTEVGQLGLALNTMLDGIEESFHERDATERRLRQFLADASHELRTPLTSIRGFAELFRLGGDQDLVDLPVIMRRIEQESARMKMLVEDLFLLAQLDETRPVASQPVDLAVLAADACSDAVVTDPDRTVTLDAPAPVVVAGDSDHLRQAIANLVQNAFHHTPPGTPVEVSTHQVGGRAEVQVRDHGAGLDDEALSHVFDRFWRADAARVGTGSGLGLSIVAGIAEEHGAIAEAANAVDGGAVFTLVFPPPPPD